MMEITSSEAKLAASIMKTWCRDHKCEDCFVNCFEKNYKPCSLPSGWDVPYIGEENYVKPKVEKKS
ncbi:hypothetical protein SAMN05660742_111103 [Propionispira arboris]|uniref:Uncharacterized protein n=1 Tax=Propionispira arboris TaxID=84035 RepID=A0A1H7A6C0_9FIRM|nr:hypothetical protein [Propionispira arboris]SEJ59994.1 hypothetical protein SAMN05660742_111103 [Propionispira arboris]